MEANIGGTFCIYFDIDFLDLTSRTQTTKETGEKLDCILLNCVSKGITDKIKRQPMEWVTAIDKTEFLKLTSQTNQH